MPPGPPTLVTLVVWLYIVKKRDQQTEQNREKEPVIAFISNACYEIHSRIIVQRHIPYAFRMHFVAQE